VFLECLMQIAFPTQWMLPGTRTLPLRLRVLRMSPPMRVSCRWLWTRQRSLHCCSSSSRPTLRSRCWVLTARLALRGSTARAEWVVGKMMAGCGGWCCLASPVLWLCGALGVEWVAVGRKWGTVAGHGWKQQGMPTFLSGAGEHWVPLWVTALVVCSGSIRDDY
jgi:hypothetical protein